MSIRSCVPVVATLIVLLSGCRCGGSLGDPCDSTDDCDPGQFCNPADLTCQKIGTDSGMPGSDAGTDSGLPGTDSGLPGTDSGLPGTDSGLPGTDSGLPGTDSGLPGTDSATGADAAMCVDNDGDGVTDCAGDCDDGDPFTYPGAPEVCGDGVTNDCNSIAPPDTGCGGIGTYVAPPPVGSNANPGTQASPVATINMGIANALTIGGGVDVYVAADTGGPGIYNEDIVMQEGISLLGGYESSGWTRDSATNVTVIDSVSPTGVFFGGGITRITAIDGFVINGVTGPNTAMAITVLDGSSPEITGNVINGPSTGAGSYGIIVNPNGVINTGSPLVAGNMISVGTSASGWGFNTGGYGIHSMGTMVEIVGNGVLLANTPSVQRGLDVVGSPGAFVAFNTVRGTGSAEVAFGIRAAGGTAEITNNDVDPGACFDICIGIALEGPIIAADVTNNIAFGGAASVISVALSIAFEVNPGTAPDILVHSNYFNGGGVPAGPGGVSTSIGISFAEDPNPPMLVGRLYNNIVRSGIAALRYAILEFSTNIDPELIYNNALSVDLSTPAIDSALYLDEGSINLTTAAMVNGLTSSMANLDDACMVTNPVVGGDFHLLAGSMCIDAGSSLELPMADYEGDPRPMGLGPDIGVDETP